MDRKTAIEEFMHVTGRMLRAPKDCQIPGPARGEAASLVLLHLHGGKVLPGEMARSSGVSTARIAAILKQLESKGYITRDTSPADRRQVEVALTESGKTAAQQEMDFMFRKWNELLDFLGEKDTESFLHLMGRFADFAEMMAGKAESQE